MSTLNDTTIGQEADPRQLGGQAIAATRTLIRKPSGVWLVPSSTAVRPVKYTVDPGTEECSCPDFEERQARCKHLWAVECTERRRTDGQGTLR